jgi:flagellin
LRIRSRSETYRNQRNLRKTNEDAHQATRRLASGKRVNSSVDDVAGRSQADILNATIRSKGQAIRNANESVSVVQIAEGAMGEIGEMLVRLREIAIQGASDNSTTGGRMRLSLETDQLKNEIHRISHSASFSGVELLKHADRQFSVQIDSGYGMVDQLDIELGEFAKTFDKMEILSINTMNKNDSMNALERIDNAMEIISQGRSHLGAVQSRLGASTSNLTTNKFNLSGQKAQIEDADVAQETAKLASAKLQKDTQLLMRNIINDDPSFTLKLFE